MEDEVQTAEGVDVTSYTAESSGSTTTTKDAAKIVAHASKTNEPLDSVERRLSTIPTNIKTFDIFDDQQSVTPLLNDYISSHPLKQKAVEKDVPQYSYAERTLGKLGSLYGKTTKSMELSRLALSIADYRNDRKNKLAGSLNPDLYQIKDEFDLAAQVSKYDSLKAEVGDLSKYDTGEDTATETATGVLGLLAQIGTAPARQPKVATAGAIGAGGAMAATGVGVLASLPSAAIGAIGASSIIDNFTTTAGSIYQEAYLDNPRKAFINEEDAYYISLAGGAVSGGIEYVQQVFTFGGSKLLDKVPGAKGLTRKAIVQALRTGKGTAVIATARALGKAVASSMEEYGQQIVQGVATDISAGKNETKPIGERVWIAAKENATSDAALQSATIGAFAPAAVTGTVKGVTSLGKTAKGYFVDVNEKLGEAGAVDTGGGDGQPPSDNGEAKPKKEFRFVIQDTEVKKAKQAEATAKFIKDVAETRYTEANPDTVEAVEKGISPEGYGFVHVADMEALTAQDAKLLKKWQSFTGQLGEGTKVVKIANHDIVALQRINSEVANIYRVAPDATSVKSHEMWLEKLDNNRQKVQDLMTQLDAEQKDVSQLFEGDVKYAPDTEAKDLFHGTDRQFQKFEQNPKTNKWDNTVGGLFFTDKKNVAEFFAWNNAGGYTQIDEQSAISSQGVTEETFNMLTEGDDTQDWQADEFYPTQKGIQNYAVNALNKGLTVYYEDQNGQMQKFEGTIPSDGLANLKIFKKGRSPRVITAKVKGKTLDIVNKVLPNELMEKLKTGNKSDRILYSIAKENPDIKDFKYQMGANYTLIPTTQEFVKYMKENGYTNVLMPDAMESGSSSYYVPDISNIVTDKEAGITKSLNEAVAQSSENILPDTVQVDQATKETLKVEYDFLTEQLDNAIKKQDSQAIQVASDNLVEHITRKETDTLKKSESIYTQLKDLGLNITKSTMKLVRADAKTVVGETKLNQMDPRIFAQNAREYAREANVALSRGDYDAYYEAKRLQLTNIEAIKETQKVKNEISKLLNIVENVSSYNTQQQLKVLNNNSVEFINDIISIFNVDTRDGKTRLDTEEYNAFVKDLMARNVPVPTLTTSMFETTGVELKTLTPNQIRAIGTALNSAVVATKKEITLFRKDKEVKLASVVERIHTLLSPRKDVDPEASNRVQSILTEKDLATHKKMIRDSLGVVPYTFNAILANLADIAKYDLDLGENNAFFTQLFYNPLLESANEKAALVRTFNDTVAKFIKFYGVKEWRKLETQKVNFFNTPLSKAELIMMTGYLGTDSGRKRLARWLGQDINDITKELEKHVTAKDVANVQKFINFYETVMIPKEVALDQRMGNVPKNQVPAVPFKFAGKEFNGGYLPLNTIMDDLARAQRQTTSEAERIRSGQVNVETMTHNTSSNTSELSRDENSALPIDLSLTEVKHVFDLRAQDIAYRETAYNLNRILGDPISQKALANVLGTQKYFILLDNIQALTGNRYANEVATEKKAKGLLNTILNNNAIAALGFNIKTVVKQPASFPLMIKNLSASSNVISATKHMTAAVASILSNPITWFQQAEFISKFDAEFAAKFTQWNKNNPDFLRLAKSIDPTLDQVEDHRNWMSTRGWQAYKGLSMAPLSYVSLMLNTIQWTAAYNLAMEGKAQNVKPNTKDAALYATKMVKYSLERNESFEKSDLQKLWYTKAAFFMTNQLSVQGSFFVNQFNVAGRKTKNNPRSVIYQYSKASINSYLAVAVPAMILKLLFGKATEDENGEVTEEYEKLIANPKTWIAKNTLWGLADSIPVMSSISYMIQANLDYGNPVSDTINGAVSAVKLAIAFFQDEDLSEFKYKGDKYKAKRALTGAFGIARKLLDFTDTIFNYIYPSDEQGQNLKLYKDLPDGIPSTDKNDDGMYDVARESLNALWQGKDEVVEPNTDTAASILQELEDSAQTREEAQFVLTAKRLTSPRGYLINPEYRQVTINTADSQKVIQLTKEEDKDLEIYLDTIGRKETGNYTDLVNDKSSARGYMQIVDGTRASLQNLYPEYDIYKNTPTLELPKDVQFDMGRKLNMEVYRKIKDLGIESDDTRYSMWYITGHVLGNSPEGRAVIQAYKDGNLNTKIKDIIPENIVSGNTSLFGRLSDDLTLAEVIDKVENGYDNVKGIIDYRGLSEKDYDDEVGAIE